MLSRRFAMSSSQVLRPITASRESTTRTARGIGLRSSCRDIIPRAPRQIPSISRRQRAFKSSSRSRSSTMAQEFSFDVVSKTDMQEVANALQQAQKELAQRFDFKGSKS